MVQVNGESVACAPGTKLPDFLTALGYQVRLIAVEYNGEILHRQFWEETLLTSGDRLEVVTVVGGG
ncbi:MAG: sulfur carrier protein ThiS [Pseudanabaenaceae cyanobacterium]